jgi:hypothetical protein
MTLSYLGSLSATLPGWSPDQLRRLHLEIEQIAREFPDFHLGFLGTDVISWEGRVEADGKQLWIAVVCDPVFPDRPPAVFPLDESHCIRDLRESLHQNADRTMCLFTPDGGQNSWHPSITLSEVIRRARIHWERLVQGEHIDVHTDWFDPLSKLTCSHRFLLPHTLQRWFLGASQRRGQFGYILLPGSMGIVSTHFEPRDTGHAPWKESFPSLPEESGVWIRDRKAWNSVQSLIKGTITSEECLARIAHNHALTHPGPVLICNTNEAAVQAWLLDCPLCGNLGSNQPPLTRVQFVDLRAELISRMPDESLPHKLRERGLLIVGCGSLGSAVVDKLLRSGYERFYLSDFDIVDIPNILRHSSSLASLYRRKVDVIRDYIVQRNPYATVRTYPYDLFSEIAYSVRTQLAERLELIVSTVANSKANLLVNRYGLKHGIPMVFASVLGKGFGGRIFRVIPEHTPCYNCCALLQDTFPRRFVRFTPEADQQLACRDGHYDMPGIPGLARDIDMVASLVERFASATLEPDCPLHSAFVRQTGDHFLWSNYAGWEFDRPFELRRETYYRVNSCPSCDPSLGLPLSVREERRLMQAMLRHSSRDVVE